MARTHGRILISIWRDPEFVSLSPGAQRLYLLLLSQRDIDSCGVQPLMMSKWAKGCKRTTQADIREALAELQIARFVCFDIDTEELLIRTFIKNDGIIKQPNFFKNALKSARTVESQNLRNALAEELRSLGRPEADLTADEISVEPIGNPYGTLPEGFRNPSGTHVEGFDDENSANRRADKAEHSSNSGTHREPIGNPSGTHRDGCGEGEGEGMSVGTSSSVLKSVGIRSSVDDHSTAIAAPPKTKPKRGTRIPTGWQPDQHTIDQMRTECPQVDFATEHRKFVDYWAAVTGSRGTKLDWNATWRNWIRKASEHTTTNSRMSPNWDKLLSQAAQRDLDDQRRSA